MWFVGFWTFKSCVVAHLLFSDSYNLSTCICRYLNTGKPTKKLHWLLSHHQQMSFPFCCFFPGVFLLIKQEKAAWRTVTMLWHLLFKKYISLSSNLTLPESSFTVWYYTDLRSVFVMYSWPVWFVMWGRSGLFVWIRRWRDVGFSFSRCKTSRAIAAALSALDKRSFFWKQELSKYLFLCWNVRLWSVFHGKQLSFFFFFFF